TSSREGEAHADAVHCRPWVDLCGRETRTRRGRHLHPLHVPTRGGHMSPSPGKPVDWSVADDWFAEFITGLEASKARRGRLRREGRVPIPARDSLARDYADRTEHLRRMLAVERAKRRHINQYSSVSGGSFVL